MTITRGNWGAVAIWAMLPTLLFAQPTAAPATRTDKCSDAAHHAFDFWIGVWTVTDTATGAAAGHSVVESLYAGCAIRENWVEPGYSGGSLNTYDAASGKWRQTWTDSSNSWREFVGGLESGNMVLTWRHPSLKDPTKEAWERMTFTPNADGSVRQHTQGSRDMGASWAEIYDYTYRREARGARPG